MMSGMTFPRGMREVYKMKAKGHPKEKEMLALIDTVPGIIDLDNEDQMNTLTVLREELGQIEMGDYDNIPPVKIPQIDWPRSERDKTLRYKGEDTDDY